MVETRSSYQRNKNTFSRECRRKPRKTQKLPIQVPRRGATKKTTLEELRVRILGKNCTVKNNNASPIRLKLRRSSKPSEAKGEAFTQPSTQANTPSARPGRKKNFPFRALSAGGEPGFIFIPFVEGINDSEKKEITAKDIIEAVTHQEERDASLFYSYLINKPLEPENGRCKILPKKPRKRGRPGRPKKVL